jgi:carnitine O-acetyltransferase
MQTNRDSRHIVVIRRGQFCTFLIPAAILRPTNPHDTQISDYFDVIDQKNRPILTEREIQQNLRAILEDADTVPSSQVARSAVGVLTTENRKHWAELRRQLQGTNTVNKACLEIVDDALFVVCLDDGSTDALEGAKLCMNFLCGTYQLTGSVQTGTSTTTREECSWAVDYSYKSSSVQMVPRGSTSR